ncbi:MAG TPA: nucleotide exchange factor GrpE [Paludibacteraceae bacterium]|nr:nucleotide exchange factor GrpE [Paludibacteraceae bacterium]
MENKDKEQKAQSAEEKDIIGKDEFQEQAEDTQSQVDDAKTEEKSDADKLAELEAKCQTMHEDYLRLFAEFDNYRKRTLKEKSELIKSAGENILVDILPLVDDFERANKSMENSDSVEGIREGVNLIYNKLMNFLSSKGVKAIETEGMDFDTEYHEAITTIPAPTSELKGKIVDCTQKGYMLNDKVIRYSKVVIGE